MFPAETRNSRRLATNRNVHLPPDKRGNGQGDDTILVIVNLCGAHLKTAREILDPIRRPTAIEKVWQCPNGVVGSR
jgi:hypothetical protein